MSNELRRFCLALYLKKGFGPRAYNELIQRYGDLSLAYNAWLAGEVIPELKKLPDLESYPEFICQADADYPFLLSQTADAPILFSYVGNKDLLARPALAVVGSRKYNHYGEKVTKEYVLAMVGSGAVVVSGMAYGIDSIAHEQAISEGGKTIAVIPGGLEHNNIAGNAALYSRIVASGGLIISEQLFPDAMHKGLFVSRNRIIAGLTLRTLVTMAGEKSGALITANLALDYGREVFVVPGPIDDVYSLGCNHLIRDGVGRLTVTPTDMDLLPNTQQDGAVENLSETARDIYYAIVNRPLGLDEISRQFDRSTGDALSLLAELSILGLIFQDEIGRYCKS